MITSASEAADSQTRVLLVFTNTSNHMCRVHGFPGVDLLGADSQRYGARYSLPRATVTPANVDVSPGGSAHAVITYLPGDWTPSSLVTTPPDETTQLTVAWPSSIGVLRQDGATHAGTFIGPMLAGAQ